MTTRTVKILGWGTGSATINAKLDDLVVFSGPVSLVEMSEENQTEHTAPTVFEFELPMDFAGSKQMSILVESASVRFGQIVINYVDVEMGSIRYSSGADIYYDIVDEDSQGIKDPRTNVSIDGIPGSADRSLGRGTWHWTVNPGSTIEYTLTVSRPGLAE